jgi:hypothetical protein
MSDINPEAARARARAMREERAARARQIRRRIISGSVALFAATWLLITIVLVSGHDPALAKRSAATTTTSNSSAATTAASGSTTTSGSGSGSDGSGSSSGASSQNSGSVSSVTTRQS